MKQKPRQFLPDNKVTRGPRMAAEIHGRSQEALANANRKVDLVITEGRNLLKPLPWEDDDA